MWHLTGTHGQLMDALTALVPDAWEIPMRAQQNVPYGKRQVWPWQAAVLGILARGCNKAGAQILEIGTALGFSATVLAQAAPLARVVTANPKDGEFERALPGLQASPNIKPVKLHSNELLAQWRYPLLDMVFVDGDHRYDAVRQDWGWFYLLQPRGLILFHDYSPEGSRRPTPDTFRAVNDIKAELGRDFDVLVTDDSGVGMAGWRRQPSD